MNNLIYQFGLFYIVAVVLICVGLNAFVTLVLTLIAMNGLFLFQCGGGQECLWYGAFLMIPASIGLIVVVLIAAGIRSAIRVTQAAKKEAESDK